MHKIKYIVLAWGMLTVVMGASKMTGILPPHIRTIGIIAPASPPYNYQLNPALKILRRAGIKYKLMPHVWKNMNKDYFKPVPARERVADFEQAWMDPEIDLIWCARGGGDSIQLLKLLDWKKLATRPNMPLLGFSDITSLQLGMLAKGIGHPYSGPSVSSLPNIEMDSLYFLRDVLAGKKLKGIQLKAVRAGACSGYALAGHLHRHNLMKVTLPEFSPDTTGKIIFFECVSHRPERIKNYLESLRKHGYFDKCAGVVYCKFLFKGNPAEMTDVLHNFAKTLNCPVWEGFPNGHSPENYTIDTKRRVTISATGLLTFEPVKRAR